MPKKVKLFFQPFWESNQTGNKTSSQNPLKISYREKQKIHHSCKKRTTKPISELIIFPFTIGLITSSSAFALLLGTIEGNEAKNERKSRGKPSFTVMLTQFPRIPSENGQKPAMNNTTIGAQKKNLEQQPGVNFWRRVERLREVGWVSMLFLFFKTNFKIPTAYGWWQIGASFNAQTGVQFIHVSPKCSLMIKISFTAPITAVNLICKNRSRYTFSVAALGFDLQAMIWLWIQNVLQEKPVCPKNTLDCCDITKLVLASSSF